MKKRILAFLLLTAMVSAVLCGCGDGNAASGSEAQSGGAAQTNEITVGIAQDLDSSLDPHKTVTAGTREVMFNVFEGLMKPTSEGDLIPAVAEDYSISEDRLSYTFTLREGVKFHNGEDVTAEDVIWSIQRCIAPEAESGVIQVDAFSAISDISADESGSTVTITLAEPNPEFLSYMTNAVLPADYTEQDTAPVGTGPFKFVSRAAQDSVVLERFDEYWGTPAYLDRVTFRIIENSESLVMSLQSGAIDLCNHLPTLYAGQLGDDFEILEGNMSLVQALYLNNAVEPFNDVRVRQALCYAVDREQILDLAFDGYGSLVGTSMYPAFAKYFDDSLTNYYTYDIEKAKELLTEAGYPDGFEMSITVPSNYPQHVDTAQVLAEQLKAINVTVKILQVEWPTWVEETYTGRQFQSTVVGVDAASMTARAMLERFVSDYGKNFINYKNDDYDVLFAQAQSCYDDDEQVKIYQQMERNLAENAANVYIQAPADLMAVRKGLEGAVFYPIYALDLSGVRYTA